MKTKPFVHLHVHSHYSLMDGCNTIPQLVDRAIKNRMHGMALTDTGNMYGIMEFFDYVSKVNSERKKKGQRLFKPILGCELYVAKHGAKEQKESLSDLKGYHLTLLAKNLTGYKNLIKIVSKAWSGGFNASPRTDRMDLEKYHEGLIVCSGGYGSEVFTHVAKEDTTALEETLQWYRQAFGEDYYIELQRMADDAKQEKVNQVLIQAAKDFNVKVVCTNDVRFTTQSYAEAYEYQRRIASGNTTSHLCLKTDSQKWMQSRSEMAVLFADIPEAIDSSLEILEKVEFYDIHHVPVLPKVSTQLTSGQSEDKHLRDLVYEKARQIYGNSLPEDVEDRLNFELDVIKLSGATSYFLFVQDIISAAVNELGVQVGPGRGSSAGSLVSYCLGITKIDPLKHDLLFERFLCPGRISLPDIDFDLDEEGRTRIINWLEKKYGKERCGHIITFSTMSAKKAIKSMARVDGLSSEVTKHICDLLPYRAFRLGNFLKTSATMKKMRRTDPVIDKVLRVAQMLEGTVCDTGVHACGFVVADKPVNEYAPTMTQDTASWGRGIENCVQYDGVHVEDAGLVKMDFLMLDVLSQQKAICEKIKETQGKDINLDLIPTDDTKTFELFQNGETQNVFTFETKGERQYLRKLRPTQFEDLVLLNALYHPGVMKVIPTLISRKNGKRPIRYAIPGMEKYLHESYGVLTYQEQVMLLSRLIADFNRVESDTLRKALGRKNHTVLQDLKTKFITGGQRNGYTKPVLNKIWKDWEKRGMYLFNKAHAVCYTWIAYQMAYLKANYPTEFSEVMSSK